MAVGSEPFRHVYTSEVDMILELLIAGVIGGLVARGGRRTAEYRTTPVKEERDPNYGVARISAWRPLKLLRPACAHEMDPVPCIVGIVASASELLSWSAEYGNLEDDQS